MMKTFLKKLHFIEDKVGMLSTFPTVLELFINEDCDLRCHGCTYYVVDDDYFHKDKYITFDYFLEVMHKFEGDVEVLYFAGGESTLHPDFEKMLNYCQSKNIVVRFTSNGIKLHSMENVLTHPAIDNIGISVDSFDYPSFRDARNAKIKQYDELNKSWVKTS